MSETTIERRRRLLGGSYRLFYDEPLEIVRGDDVWLHDSAGRRYLDAYNNVPCVGHANPRVAARVAEQMGRLNTHTRYLDTAILDYSEALLDTFPDAISQVMYTCTGSEAVDLALRIAARHNGGAGIVVTDNAYHGTSAAVAAISPSLGPGVPIGPHVRTVAPPLDGDGDAFAGRIAAAFADLARHGITPLAFIADGIFSSDGVVADPPGLLAPALDAVHAAGALYIADEVQPGFGRLGPDMWGFARHGITPDLAVMGKPMGGGLPIAAVALRPEIGAAFGETVRYFNTFAGGHVTIAAAAEVLSILTEPGFLDRVGESGTHLRTGLRALADRSEAIVEVRGAGLFAGVEMAVPAGRIVEAMRRRGVLLNASGPKGDVLKIRPPLTFTPAHGDLLLDALSDALEEVA
ncbi:4-aminobutyrate aminotransferase-like enzyme [Palleronia aestuarii]|uniref:4-aminobutyrate aminotransferase-like enzyme n=1 Tax=Palleronia aestuarii TaxID=568105 RepID=A0A2W7P145_9RHOB|nr:aminotransferase class III-fold pyridoxal phosphate-dependent enzyme [Palleronia aestuarii]PZX17172.1 4-aminobutyrate aminotransferase-like enzyme [Palleronia aestuarii]